jgi:hypothetical protein
MDNQHFYIIDPAHLEFSSVGMSLQQRRNRLGELIRASGAQWQSIRMRSPDFLAIVEKLDALMNASEDFVQSAFENSPRQILTIGSTAAYDPLLGYYEPDRVREFDRKLRAIPESGEAPAAQVLHAFRSTFAEAAKRNAAVALEHR